MKCEVLIDYFTFTVRGEESPQAVIKKWLSMDPALFEDPGYGLLGYNKILRFSDIVVCYEPREDENFHNMGICVSMSGKGCRAFETMSHFKCENSPFEKLFELISIDPDAKMTRIDIACDDHSGMLDMDTIIDKFRNNDINSRTQKRQIVLNYDGSDYCGATCYLGSPSSEFRTRIYNKALEQHVDGHWIRVELVLRSQHADLFVDNVVNYALVGELAAAVINDKFSFIERDDSNISRCSVCGWWRDFVGSLEKVHLVSRKAVQSPVEKIASWYEAQVGPSAAILIKTLGFDLLLDIAFRSESRLTSKQEAIIDDWRQFRRVCDVTQK